MTHLAALAAMITLAAGPPSPAPPGRADGEVRAVSVLPAAGRVEVVIDLQGAVEVQDFTLRSPARLVIDLVGARLTAPAALYDGQNRGGVRNVRYAQFKPDVVRVVIDLDAVPDYQVERAAGQVRVRIGTERTAFAAWSSRTVASLTLPAAAPAARAAPAAGRASAGGLEQAARVRTPSVGRAMSIDEYLATHRNEALQSQAPRITVQWDAADIEDVVAGFAAFSGRTIIIGRGVAGKVTAEIKNQPWDLAFNAVLESQGLAVQNLPGGIFNVVSKVELARADSTVPIETRLVRINYARSTSLVPAVQSIVTQRGKVVADSVTNSLVITEVSSRVDQVVDFVKGLDLRTPQVSIQAKIILVDRTDVEEMGVKYDLGSASQFFNRLIQRPDPSTAEPVDTDLDGVPDALVPTETFDRNTDIIDLGGNSLSAIGNAAANVASPALELIFSTAIGNFDLTTFVQALQSVQLADVQAEPTITTVDNRQAEILVGDRVPIRIIDPGTAVSGGAAQLPRATVKFEQTGINLRVTPHVTANRQILMEVHAERSALRAASSDVGFTFQTQQADNQILVNDGETVVVGGLTVTEVTVQKTGIPFLVDLPILGKLFGFSSQTENRRDLLILITPHIIDDLVAPTGQ
jgi:type IV pilus assembly protein PilQ